MKFKCSKCDKQLRDGTVYTVEEDNTYKLVCPACYATRNSTTINGARFPINDARSTLDLAMSEKDFLNLVMEYAEVRGWMVYHQFEQRQYARRKGQGFPDLVMVRATDGRLIFAELKSEKGRLSVHQKLWFDALCEGCSIENYYRAYEVHVWRPSDWPEIEEVLR